jgi:RNA polymerase sigma factor (sigma-70 family)
MEDATLLCGCIEGNRQSRSEFLDKYSRLIYSYIRRVVALKAQPCASDHINDIFQELFCSLFAEDAKKLKSFQARNGCSFATWLRQVTVNFTIDYLRALRVDMPVDAERGIPAQARELPGTTVPSAAEGAIAQELLQKLRECVELLDTDSRFFLEMHLNRGVRLVDLSGLLNVSRGSVDMFKSRLLARLRECFKTKGYADE